MRLLIIIISFIFFAGTLQASLYCPPNKVLECDEDLNNPNVTGMATTYGGHAQYVASYILIEPDNYCGVGLTIKRWYVDENFDGQLNPGEHYCDQEILVDYHAYPITYNIPPDITISCLDDIPAPIYSWNGGSPCDVIGYKAEDKDFTVANGDCLKIIRKYEFINWCTYHPNDPNWNGEGKWEFDQIIKVIDEEKPELSSCNIEEFGVGANCETEVILTNSAVDMGSCPGNELAWQVEIDLWADGTTDYVFGFTESGIFKTEPTQNGQDLEIKIPELLGPGNHKVKWNVRDACGNWTSCPTTFKTVDKKPPTPYCHSVIFSSFDGSEDMSLDIDANLFDIGSFDFCYPDYIKISYSEDPEDDTLTIDCTNTGFQFLRIYAHDKAGNSDFCETFLLIFDNGTCNGRIATAGIITNAENIPLNDVSMEVKRHDQNLMMAYTNDEGHFEFKDLPLNNDITFKPSLVGLDKSKIDILDLIILKEYLLGIDHIQGPELLAMDLNDDKKINAEDFYQMTDYILDRIDGFTGRDWSFVQQDRMSEFNLRTHKDEISFMDYMGNLNYIGFMKGDISSLEPRSKMILNLTPGERNTDGFIPYYAIEDFETKGIHLNIAASDDIKILNGQFYIEAGNFEKQAGNIHWIIKEGLFDTTTPLFYIRAESIEHIAGIGYSKDWNKQTIQLDRVEKSNLSVYPNPGSDKLTIQYTGEAYQVNIFDLYGQLIYSTPFKRNMDIINLQRGTYILEAVSKNEKQRTVFVKI
jgi:hypothetical protein